MNVDASIITNQVQGALAIPAAAVSSGSRVLVKSADGSTGQGAPTGYQYVRVELGISDGNFVQVVSGLKDGDEIAWQPDGPSKSSLENMMTMGPMGGQAGGHPGGMGGQMTGRPGGNAAGAR